MFRKILCPVDLTTWTSGQLLYAKSFARFQCADIQKVCIHKHRVLQPHSVSKEVHSYQHPVAPSSGSSSTVPQTVMIFDSTRTAHQLHKIAVDKHFDLIMMPVNLESGLERQCETIFREVFSSSAIPILALPKKIKFKLPKRILCVIDLNQDPSKISHYMPEFAAEAHAKYFVMNSFEADEKEFELSDHIISRAEKILSYIMKEISYALGADEITVRIGHASDEILEQIEDKKIDMLFIGFNYFRSESTRSALHTLSRLSIPALCIPETNGSLYTVH